MSSYYLAPSLVALREEIDKAFPNRDRSSDGWIGDTSHAARASDHNPDWSCGGVVRAIDVDANGADGETTALVQAVLKATIGDPRVWYVIWNGHIYSRTYGWVARVYTGSNRHDHHVHISIMHTRAAETGTAPWLPTGPKQPVKPLPIDLPLLQSQMRRAAGTEKGKVTECAAVRRLQKALNHKYGALLEQDGIAGEATLNAYGRHEAAVGASGAPRIPDMKTLPSLIQGWYYIKDAAPSKPAPRKDSK